MILYDDDIVARSHTFQLQTFGNKKKMIKRVGWAASSYTTMREEYNDTYTLIIPIFNGRTKVQEQQPTTKKKRFIYKKQAKIYTLYR